MLSALRFGSHWHVLVVNVGREIEAENRLRGMAGVEPYCPRHRVWQRVHMKEARRIGCSRKIVTWPLMPGYLFFKADIGVVGVRQVVMQAEARHVLIVDGRACIVRNQLIEAMQAAETNGQWDRVELEINKLQSQLGKPYLIRSGPMRGFMGTLRAIDFAALHETITVEVELLQRNVDVVLDPKIELMNP
jgi:transcription antitermination factor NusG